MELAAIAVIAFLSSILSGLLGIGGAVILIPAYHYLPPVIGMSPISVALISGMTSVQVLASSIAGTIVHRNRGAVHRGLVITMGIPITLSAFVGALASGLIAPHIILYLFGTMALAGALLIVIQKPKARVDINDQQLQFSKYVAVAIAVIVGVFGGIVGAAGGFLLAPMMMVFLKVPIRVTIGSTLGIVVLSALATSIGKFFTGQIPPLETIVAVAASLPGVVIGSLASQRARPESLRMLLALLIAGIGFSMFWN
jgi:uncharacterized membrane protein YfcA